jgi:AcrR family transcriptional regulator
MATAEKSTRLISREMIESTALKLFKKNGVDGTSVNDIVKQAGIAKGTFYLYFKNKDDLINGIFENFSEDFFHRVFLENRNNLKITDFAGAILNYFTENTMFLFEMMKNMHLHKEYPYYRKIIDRLSTVIVEYINIYDDYPIQQLNSYSEVLIGTIFEICHKLLVTGTIENTADARMMLEDFMKRFFNCDENFFLQKNDHRS